MDDITVKFIMAAPILFAYGSAASYMITKLFDFLEFCCMDWLKKNSDDCSQKDK